jgi:hypothetical protein
MSMARVVGYVPVTMVGVVLVCTVFAVSGVWHEAVEGLFLGGTVVFNPLVYTINIFFHADWGHYAGNMTLWIPFAAVLTWLTSNRHVLMLVVTVNFLTVVTALFIEGVGLGLSHVVLGVGAAALVRSIDYALADSGPVAVQSIVVGIMFPLSTGFLLVMVLAGPRFIADFYHFLGFLFGGAIEAIYVFSELESDDDGGERTIPKTLGR